MWYAHQNVSTGSTSINRYKLSWINKKLQSLNLFLPLITNAMSDRYSLLKNCSFNCCFMASLKNVAMLGFSITSLFRIFSHIAFSEGNWNRSLACSNWARRSSGTSLSGSWGSPGNKIVHQSPCMWEPGKWAGHKITELCRRCSPCAISQQTQTKQWISALSPSLHVCHIFLITSHVYLCHTLTV